MYLFRIYLFLGSKNFEISLLLVRRKYLPTCDYNYVLNNFLFRYLENTLKETLRKWPIATGFGRTLEDDEMV